MKKLLFVIPNYDYGGTITSLRNLLPLLNSEQYNIDIFAITPNGHAYVDLEQYATIIGKPQATTESFHVKSFLISVKYTISSLARHMKKILTNIGIDISPFVFKSIGNKLSKRNYDIVIAFQEGQATLLASYIQCSTRIAWQHSIFSRFVSMINLSSYKRILSMYDKIVCVSNTAKTDFEDTLPEFSSKLFVVYNAIDELSINTKAKKDKIKLGDNINIVSVGRIDKVKRFSKIPKITRALLNHGVNIDWWVIGGKADEQEYKSLVDNIAESKVDDNVHLVGRLDNPYSYIAKSDILVCLSSSETFNYTIAEAKCLGIPVVTTNFKAAYEFVKDGETGLISSIDEIDSAIVRILQDNCHRTIIKGLKSESSDNKQIVCQLIKILE